MESKAARWSSLFAKQWVLRGMSFDYSVFRNMGCSVGCAGRIVTPNRQGSNPGTPLYAGVGKMVKSPDLGSGVLEVRPLSPVQCACSPNGKRHQA